MRDQESEIIRLGNEISSLREELSSRPTDDDLNRMRSEWQTSEALFAESQRDNEEKHSTIENMRQYIRILEAKLEETFGEEWRHFCPLPLPTAPNAFGASTPLHKLRSSASIKRASRTSRLVSAPEARALKDQLTGPAATTTPAGALRTLEGIKEAPSTASPATPTPGCLPGLPEPALRVNTANVPLNGSSAPLSPIPSGASTRLAPLHTGSVSRPTPQQIVHSIGLGSPTRDGGFHFGPPSRQTSHTQAHGSSTARAPSPQLPPDALADQLASLSSLLAALPGTLSDSLRDRDTRRRDGERVAEREREAAAGRREEVIREQKAAALALLDAYEGRCAAREVRLQGMLAEVKACRGQMGW